jgi:SPP1 family predicted phage head-tail adaptor
MQQIEEALSHMASAALFFTAAGGFMMDITKMQAGDLRTVVRIQYRKINGRALTRALSGWISATRHRPILRICQVRWYPLGGSEVWAADSVQIKDGANVIIRYNKAITSQCRLLKGGVAYDIVDPDDPDQHRHWLKSR